MSYNKLVIQGVEAAANHPDRQNDSHMSLRDFSRRLVRQRQQEVRSENSANTQRVIRAMDARRYQGNMQAEQATAKRPANPEQSASDAPAPKRSCLASSGFPNAPELVLPVRRQPDATGATITGANLYYQARSIPKTPSIEGNEGGYSNARGPM